MGRDGGGERGGGETYQSAAPRPASRQATHGGLALSCRHLLLMRRHLHQGGRRARVSIAAHGAGDGRGKARVFVALTHLRHAIGERRLMTGAGADAGAGAEVAAGDGRLRSVPTFCMGFVSVKSMGSCSSRLEAGMDLGRGRVAAVAVVAAGSRRSPQDLGKCL